MKGWIIRKQTALAPRVDFWNTLIPQPNHWSLPVPIALAHLPKCQRAEPSQNIVPQQRRPKTNQGVCGKEPLFPATMSLKLFYKVGCSSGFFSLPLDPLINIAELMVKTCKIQNLQKTESGKLRRSTGNYTVFTRNSAGVTGNYTGVTTRLFWQLSAKH